MTAIASLELHEITRWLQRGDQKKIANKLNYGQQSVSEVLKGKWFNEDIISAAAEIALERKARVLNKIERLKQLQ